MLRILISFICAAITWNGLAQNKPDTIYLEFVENEIDEVIKGVKHENDTLDFYPFDGGRIYNFPKKVEGQTKDLMFFFRSFTPDWMEEQFEYQLVDKSILEEKDFKGRGWFEVTQLNKILDIFSRKNTIYLIDRSKEKNGQFYMVRVYFKYSAQE